MDGWISPATERPPEREWVLVRWRDGQVSEMRWEWWMGETVEAWRPIPVLVRKAAA